MPSTTKPTDQPLTISTRMIGRVAQPSAVTEKLYSVNDTTVSVVIVRVSLARPNAATPVRYSAGVTEVVSTLSRLRLLVSSMIDMDMVICTTVSVQNSTMPASSRLTPVLRALDGLVLAT